MLVENKKLVDEVLAIKLVTGEEILARCTSEAPLRVKNPLAMVMVPSEDSQQGMVAFAPWFLGATDDESFPIREDHILALVIARSDAASQYAQAIGEEVVIPPTRGTPAKSAPQVLTGAAKGGRGR